MIFSASGGIPFGNCIGSLTILQNSAVNLQYLFIFGVLLVDLYWVLIPEWWVAANELIDKDAKSPPIDGKSMP